MTAAPKSCHSSDIPPCRGDLLAPGRNDSVHARVGDQLTEMLVQVAADEERRIDRREIASHHLALAGQRRRIDRLELRLRVREPFVQVFEDLRFVRQRAQLLHRLLAAEIRGLAAESHRDERVAFHRGEHQHFADRPHTFHRPPRVLVLRKRFGERDEFLLQVIEVRGERRLDDGGRVLVDDLLRARGRRECERRHGGESDERGHPAENRHQHSSFCQGTRSSIVKHLQGPGGPMVRTTVFVLALAAAAPAAAQSIPAAPRPPAAAPGAPPQGSAAPDGYAPSPAWLGQTRAPHPAKASVYDVQTVAQGLTRAFCFSFLPDGRILVGERPGHIKIVSTDGKIAEVQGLPANLYAAQGLFEVRADRAFAANRTIYLTYAVLPDGVDAAKFKSPGVLVIARATLSADDSRLENVKVLLDAEGTGGRLIQANDGTLLVTSTPPGGVGDNAVDWMQPQQFDSDMGKILRINPDGSIPKDNPFAGRAGAKPEIFALGFRDIQGVALHPKTGQLWTSEHGPRGGDEINAVAKGKNYGFPVIGYGREYSGKPINNDRTAQEGMEQPVYFWTPDIAPSGIAFYTGKQFPAWQGDLFVSALAGKSLVRLVLNGDRVVAEERLLNDLGARVRGVATGPDGALYVLTDGNDGKILRLVPKHTTSH